MYIKVMCEKCSALQEESSEGLHAAYTPQKLFLAGNRGQKSRAVRWQAIQE